MLVRNWQCECGNRFTERVVFSPTTNISGEKTVYCPKCHRRAIWGSPHQEIPDTVKRPTGLTPYIAARKNKQELRELRTERLLADFLAATNDVEHDAEMVDHNEAILDLLSE